MGETFYHVDRGADLAAGKTIELESVEGWGPEVDHVLADCYPGGFSKHGEHYCTQDLHGDDADDIWDFACEAIFELVRATRFPGRPSRLQSVYGFETREAVERFLAEFVEPPSAVWEVAAERTFRADMHLVDATDFADGLHRADYYWRGETFRDDPLWEVLMVPPVEVVSRADV